MKKVYVPHSQTLKKSTEKANPPKLVEGSVFMKKWAHPIMDMRKNLKTRTADINIEEVEENKMKSATII